MLVSLITTETIWMDRISLILSAINGSVLLFVLIVQFCGVKNTNVSSRCIQNLEPSIKILNLFAICCIFFGVLLGFQKMIASFAIDTHCQFHVILGIILWLSMKHSLYLFFIIRLHVAFTNSIFQFSTKIFVFLYLLIIISYSTQLLIYIIYGNGELFANKYCISNAPFWTRMYNAIWDLIMSLLLTILFIKKLYNALIKTSREEFKNTNIVWNEISKIAQYITLSLIAIFTTLISLILFGIFSWFTFTAIDMIINEWCIFLMYRKNIKCFNCICTSCHKCVGSIFYKLMEYNHVFDVKQPPDTDTIHDDDDDDIDDEEYSTRKSFLEMYHLENEGNINHKTQHIHNTDNV